MAASGLAGKIRRVQESDEFDLGGQSRDQVFELAKAAFTDPLELKSMVKLTFVVGGGKQCRQKYGADLPKDFQQALDSIGFNSDSAACCELASAGTYKYQHDTSKNLLFVHVFPRVVCPAGDEDAEEGEEQAAQPQKRDPADVLAECETADFQRMVTANVVTYSSKKRLLDSLRAKLGRLDEAEQKMIAREEVDAELQKLYDTLSADGLKEKVKLMTAELQSSIDAGDLTSAERSQVLEQLGSKLSALQTELEKAEADGKPKLQAKLEEQKEKLKTTKASVSDLKPAGPRPLKYEAEIQKLHVRLTGLARLEKEAGGKYTLDQLKALGERPEMEEAMSIYQTRSRTWFESDEEFDERLQQCLARAPKKKAPAAGGYSAAPAANKSDGWSTVKKKR